MLRKLLTTVITLCGLSFAMPLMAAITLLNVSYDPTREFYQDFNEAFSKYWQQYKGEKLILRQSHGGSGKQARAVIDGLPADVVTLALAYDIDEIAQQAKLLPLDWQSHLLHNSTPYTSTIVFLVRKGNPKGIKDWEDLVKPGVAVITPNPKTSGGARWNYLAAWGYTLAKFCGADKAKWQNCAEGEKQAQDFVTRLYKNVPVLDSGARGATTTFIKRGIGDVFISWENEAFLVVNKIGGKGKFEIVVPSISILAEPPVAVVEETAKKKGTLEVAKAYLEYLYTETGQRLAAKHYYRPRVETLVTPNEIKQFPHLELFTIEDFGGWQKAQATHFNDGGIFDQIYLPPSE